MWSKYSKFMGLIFIVLIFIINGSGCGRMTTNGQSVSYNIALEPETIDPALNTSINGANVILANFEGLMRLDKDNKAIPGIAESYIKLSDVKYIFKLREAKWSDGKMVTAEDFEYSWKRVLNPETHSKFAYQLYFIKNGEAYNKGLVTADNVGIKAIDNRTIEIVLESTTDFFLELLTLPTYMPVRQDIIERDKEIWCKDPVKYIGNGPFKMTSWRSGEAIELVKNEDYYDAARIKLSKIVFKAIKDADNYLEAWEKGSIDIIEAPPPSEIPRLKSENKITVKPYLGTYFYIFNNNIVPLNDKRVRRALSYGIDRLSIAARVLNNEVIPATALIPKGMSDADASRDFRNVGGAYYRDEGQFAEAKELLEEAGYPDGKGFPQITLMYDNTIYHEEIAKAVQEMWENNLGIVVNMQPQEWEALKRLTINGSYEIARQGWIADYADPLAFLDMFVSDRRINESNYSNTMYDEIISKAKYETDRQKRNEYLHTAENLLMEDMPILPVFFYSDILLVKPYVKDVIKSPLGFVFFDQAYIERENP